MNKSWISQSLEPTETVIFETRPHWSIFVFPSICLILSFSLWWVIFIALFLLIHSFFIFFSHQFVVTDRRLIQKKGWYYIRIIDWPFEKIDDVICTQVLTDRLWKRGTVTIFGMSFPKVKLTNVGSPHDLKNSIYCQLPTRKSYHDSI